MQQQADLVTFDVKSTLSVTCETGHLSVNFGLSRAFRSHVRSSNGPYRRTDGQTNRNQ